MQYLRFARLTATAYLALICNRNSSEELQWLIRRDNSDVRCMCALATSSAFRRRVHCMRAVRTLLLRQFNEILYQKAFSFFPNLATSTRQSWNDLLFPCALNSMCRYAIVYTNKYKIKIRDWKSDCSLVHIFLTKTNERTLLPPLPVFASLEV